MKLFRRGELCQKLFGDLLDENGEINVLEAVTIMKMAGSSYDLFGYISYGMYSILL